MIVFKSMLARVEMEDVEEKCFDLIAASQERKLSPSYLPF